MRLQKIESRDNIWHGDRDEWKVKGGVGKSKGQERTSWKMEGRERKNMKKYIMAVYDT